MAVDSNLLSTSSQREKGNDDSRSFHSDCLPNPIRELFAAMVGQGVFHGTSLFQASPLVGICSSHSKRLGFADRQWLQSAVQAIKYSKSSRGRLLIAEDTPYSTFLQHLCLRLQTPLSVIQVVRSEEEIVSQQETGCDALKQVYTFQLESDEAIDPTLGRVPLHDRLLVALSSVLFALKVSPGGKIASLLKTRLCSPEIPTSSLKVAWTTPKDSDWIQRGAVGWFGPWSSPLVSQSEQSEVAWSPVLLPCHTAPPATHQPVIHSPSMLRTTSERFLIHCTRGRQGPWPDQSWGQFCDELLVDKQRYESTPFETLVRILLTGRLVATGQCKPGGIASVSFSQRDLFGLLQKRKFQKHLGRWDWEPYGFLLSRDRLEQIGARPVRYLKKSQAKETSVDDLAEVQWIDDMGCGQDWSEEREWRLFDDLRLSRCHASPGFVFVPTEHEAFLLQHASPWPVLVVKLDRLASSSR